MKCKITIDKFCEEEILVFAHERTGLVDEIERLVSDDAFELIGYAENKDAVLLSASDIHCFTVENGKVYAMTQNEKYILKLRLFRIEEELSQNFVKINQSCLANIRKIERFDASVSGALKVKFKNGFVDYISRRNIKKVKERFGL